MDWGISTRSSDSWIDFMRNRFELHHKIPSFWSKPTPQASGTSFRWAIYPPEIK